MRFPALIAASMAALTLAAAGCGDAERGAAPGASPTPEPVPVIDAGCGEVQPRPAKIILTCADAGMQLVAIDWASWGEQDAAATATLTVTGCDPSCAEDNRTYSYRADVTASNLVTCAGGRRMYATVNYEVPAEEVDEHLPSDTSRQFACPRAGQDDGAGSPRRPGTPEQAKYDALTVAALVENCWFQMSSYERCQTAAAIGASPNGKPPLRVDSDSIGEREVGIYPRDNGGYDVIAYDDELRVYTISVDGRGNTDRTCHLKDGTTPCPQPTW